MLDNIWKETKDVKLQDSEKDLRLHPYRKLHLSLTSASGTSACAACRVLRRKCTNECLFAPYFPPDQPQKFAHVHKVFGVANITKMLHELPPMQRENCIDSMAFEANARVQDPVFGCVGVISLLQEQIAHLQAQLTLARTEAARLREAFAIAAAFTTATDAKTTVAPEATVATNYAQAPSYPIVAEADTDAVRSTTEEPVSAVTARSSATAEMQ
ncbi:hypothetical protein O6H91_01G155800 [Diphasiastrum complanatum]|uniref:Uncharacterized protein n=1 Tax=Diphasiastrum complanatum TaxID=34168 RepID=A0ACC2EXJ6_DIPCM|nr:hypothetical protein O6H91_01G155800 [Diphasiastrum complanatum]